MIPNLSSWQTRAFYARQLVQNHYDKFKSNPAQFKDATADALNVDGPYTVIFCMLPDQARRGLQSCNKVGPVFDELFPDKVEAALACSVAVEFLRDCNLHDAGVIVWNPARNGVLVQPNFNGARGDVHVRSWKDVASSAWP